MVQLEPPVASRFFPDHPELTPQNTAVVVYNGGSRQLISFSTGAFPLPSKSAEDTIVSLPVGTSNLIPFRIVFRFSHLMCPLLLLSKVLPARSLSHGLQWEVREFCGI